MWSWDITYLPTTVRGVWLYLYLVIDVWSRKVVTWDVAEREDPAIAADLVSQACLGERISKSRKQPLILHSDNGNAMRAATLESRLEELGVMRSFSRARVSNDNPYSESLFRKQNTSPITQGGLTTVALLGRHELDTAVAVPVVVVPAHESRYPQACHRQAGEWPLTSAGIVPTSMNKHASGIQFAGHDPRATGVNRKWRVDQSAT